MLKIRNFCLIAHIDHGKSTLADRLLELTNTVEPRILKAQHLDTMELERERGITIKLQPARLLYQDYILNLVDTPGHADFAYEVSRSLKAVEGALLVIDATQGIEAQTLATVYAALEQNLTIIPVLNKIDLPAANPERFQKEIETVLAIPAREVLTISAKTGQNCAKLLAAIVKRVPPPPAAPPQKETCALIFDSIFDNYRGVVIFVRNFSGEIRTGQKLKLLRAGLEFEALEVGYLKPEFQKTATLQTGEIGYIVTGLKSIRDARVGETVWQGTTTAQPTPLPGFQQIAPRVFAGIFARDSADFPHLRDALEKLSLNDAALTFEPEQQAALGLGFRAGFLGLLHLEIVQARLTREYNLELIITAPSVRYKVRLNSEREQEFTNPLDLPANFTELLEPWVRAEIITRQETLGGVLKLINEHRGLQKNLTFLEKDRILIVAELPLAEIVADFYDQLKNVSAGYASLNYEHLDFRAGELTRLDFLLAGEKVTALSLIVPKLKARKIGQRVCQKLKELIPRANFAIAIQAALGSQVVARETLSAFRKDVTAKLYGGDRTRKDKLLKKQKAGKKRLQKFGKVNLPAEAFLAVLQKD